MAHYFIGNSKGSDVGKIFPQTDGMTSGYDLSAPDSVWEIPNFSKALIIPNLESFVIDSRSKLTDCISTALISASGFLMSEKAKKIFMQFNLPAHTFYPASVVYKHQSYQNFYFLHLEEEFSSKIDFSKSSFITKKPFLLSEKKEVHLTNLDQLASEAKRELGVYVYPEKLSLQDLQNKDLLSFRHFYTKTIVSETLHSELINQKCTGFDFKNISFEITMK